MSPGRRRRNAVLAPFTRWLWWSPWHLCIAVVGTLVCLGLVSALLHSHSVPHHRSAAKHASNPPHTAPPPPPASPVPSSSPPPASAPPPRLTVPPAATDSTAALAAAHTWVTLWARPAVPTAAWLSALAPYTFPDYLAQLHDTDPANVPATGAAAAPHLNTFAPAAAVVTVPLRGGTLAALQVTVIYYPNTAAGHWQVSDAQPPN